MHAILPLKRSAVRIGQIMPYWQAPVYGVIQFTYWPCSSPVQKLPDGSMLVCQQLADLGWVGQLLIGKQKDGCNFPVAILALPREKLEIFPPSEENTPT